MITQRELDIAQVEAKMKADKLFEEWRKSFLGRRAEVRDATAGYAGESPEAEDSQPAEAPDY